MKQRQHGQKVQNWHRPLRHQQLGRWYRRHRYDDIAEDQAWDDWYRYEDDFREDDEPDLRGLELNQLLRAIVHRTPPLFRREWAVMDAALQTEDEPALSAEPLEQRLAEFAQTITHFPNNPATFRRISDAIGEDVYLDVMKSAGRRGNGQRLVKNLCLFAPFWVRSPRTWIGGESSLIDHLFVRYEVPRFLYAEWFAEPGLARLKWLCWFILLAQGGSLRRAAAHFGWNIASRFEHFLRMAPDRFSPQEACAFAQVMRLGGADTDGRRIVSNPAFVIDTTDASRSVSHSEFWEAAVRWVISHSDAVTDAQCESVLAWAMHEYTEAERRGAPSFSWKGRGLRSILECSREYQRQLERPWSRYSWLRHGWDWKPLEPALEGWCFIELTSGEELFREGQAMRHCVAGYAESCAAGRSAIVSVRFKGARRITVEISPASGQVLQAAARVIASQVRKKIG